MSDSELSIDKNGNRMWYKTGINYSFKLHRLDGPAVEWADGNKVWYVNGHKHREDGPAEERDRDPTGQVFMSWYIRGTLIKRQHLETGKVSYYKSNSFGLERSTKEEAIEDYEAVLEGMKEM